MPGGAFAIQASIQALGGLYNFYLSDRNSKRAVKALEERTERTAEAALGNLVASLTTSARRREQINRQFSQVVQRLAREGAEARGVITAGAGGAGIEGASLAALERDFAAQTLGRIEIARENQRYAQADVTDQLAGIAAQGTQAIQNTMGQEVARPDIIAALFQIGTETFNAYLNNSYIDPGSGNRRLT